MSWWNSADGVKSIATTVGILGTGGFFLFKAVFGYNNVNCSIAVSSERRRKDDTTDFVSATVYLDKGSNTALSLLRGEVRFTPSRALTPSVIELHRLNTENRPDGVTINWDGAAPERALFVSPGERMHFACFAEVPCSEPCTIEAVMVGRKRLRSFFNWRRTGFNAQWRATTVSLPLAADLAHLSR
jgi:hypothetical protein